MPVLAPKPEPVPKPLLWLFWPNPPNPKDMMSVGVVGYLRSHMSIARSVDRAKINGRSRVASKRERVGMKKRGRRRDRKERVKFAGGCVR